MLNSLQFSASSLQPCGVAGYNYTVGLCVNSWVINNPKLTARGLVVKVLSRSTFYAQPYQLLYTVFAHLKCSFQSVNETLVHIIHRPYKHECKAYKGDY